MSAAISRAPSTQFASCLLQPDDIEPDITWKENLYTNIQAALQPVVNDAKRNYEERLLAAETEETRIWADEEYYMAINSINILAKDSFQTQIICERYERIWAMDHPGQEDQDQVDIEPDKAWKDNLFKTIEEALLPMVHDAMMDYGERFAAAGTGEAQYLADEYNTSMDSIRYLAKESFKAQLDRERQERMKAMERSKQPEGEQACIEPDEEWKDNLHKAIEENLQSVVDSAERDYKRRLAAASTEEARILAKAEYHENMDSIRKLIKESFQAELDRERQERMWAIKEVEGADIITLAEKTILVTTAIMTTPDSSTSTFSTPLTTCTGELSAGPLFTYGSATPTAMPPPGDGPTPHSPRPASPRSKSHYPPHPDPSLSTKHSASTEAHSTSPNPKTSMATPSFVAEISLQPQVPCSTLGITPRNLPLDPEFQYIPTSWKDASTITEVNGDPLPPPPSFQPSEIEQLRQPSPPPSGDQELKDDSSFPLLNKDSDFSNEELLQRASERTEWEGVEKTPWEPEVLGDEDGRMEGPAQKTAEECKLSELKAGEQEEEARHRAEALERREQELKKREEEAKRKEVDSLRKAETVKRSEEEIRRREEKLVRREQELKKSEEEAKENELEFLRKEEALRREEQEVREREEVVRRRENEVCQKICRLEEERGAARRKEEKLLIEARQLEAERAEVRGREEELCEEARRFGEQREETSRKEERLRERARWLEGERVEVERRAEVLRSREEELQCRKTEMTAQRDQQLEKFSKHEAADRDSERRKTKELWRQTQTEQVQHSLGEEGQLEKIHPRVEERNCPPGIQKSANGSSSYLHFPSSSAHPTWTSSQTYAWLSSPCQSSFVSVRTSISSHSTISEQHDGVMKDWQRRQDETYKEQQEQFRMEQERLKFLK